jgi:hypothetical protein
VRLSASDVAYSRMLRVFVPSMNPVSRFSQRMM